MPFFCNEDVSLHYVEHGRGEPLMLIHGLGGSAADWAFQVEAAFAHPHHRRRSFNRRLTATAGAFN